MLYTRNEICEENRTVAGIYGVKVIFFFLLQPPLKRCQKCLLICELLVQIWKAHTYTHLLRFSIHTFFAPFLSTLSDKTPNYVCALLVTFFSVFFFFLLLFLRCNPLSSNQNVVRKAHPSNKTSNIK